MFPRYRVANHLERQLSEKMEMEIMPELAHDGLTSNKLTNVCMVSREDVSLNTNR